MESLQNVQLTEAGELIILDQTQLPNRISFLTLRTAEDIHSAIAALKVRGAPAIGICAGYGIYLLSVYDKALAFTDFAANFRRNAAYLASARPTAVNLSWALGRMERVMDAGSALPVPALLLLLERECRAIHTEDIEMCRKISEFGLSLLKPGDGVLTHCNAGPLATSQYGTGLGPLLLAQERGVKLRVFSDETRPLLQGARLTAFELSRAGMDVTLICDNMASIVMKNGWIQACLVGCDRVAANGDTANKIGTSGVAILAKHYGIPFYVLGPSSTLDPICATGADIPIELRDPNEIRALFYREPMALPQVNCYNPAFDVTDHSLITAIITEAGIFRPPYHFSNP